MNSPVISVENLSKRYSITSRRSKSDGLRHIIESAMRNPLASLATYWKENTTQKEDFWALKDVSFTVDRGDVVGIIGGNGAGKSTLLKILSRITLPTAGQVLLEGRVSSLLEVGTGFHQELTGRENIFLNGAILGMRRAEISRKFDEIVDFAEIGDFLDTPVKRYSSGMYVRLAFSVAAHLEPDILIVDEVLAVGDSAFQRKCLEKMGNFAKSGKTVLFVTHNMESVRSLCQRAIWLQNGRLHSEGEADRTVEAYYRELSDVRVALNVDSDHGLTINKVSIKNALHEETQQFRPGEDIIVEIAYDAKIELLKPYLTIGITGINGACFTANMLLDGKRPDSLLGSGTIACRFFSIPLLNQSYNVRLGIRASDGDQIILRYQDVAFFNVVADLGDFGFEGAFLSRTSRYTSVVVPYEWRFANGITKAVSLSRPLG